MVARDRFCAKVYAGLPVNYKYCKDTTGQWFEVWHSSVRQVSSYGLSTMTRHNCNECKHKLVCLIDPECKQTFKGK